MISIERPNPLKYFMLEKLNTRLFCAVPQPITAICTEYTIESEIRLLSKTIVFAIAYRGFLSMFPIANSIHWNLQSCKSGLIGIGKTICHTIIW